MIISDKIIKNNKEIKVSELTKGSHQIIEAQCEFCDKQVNIQYRVYLKQTNQMEIKFACSKKCASIRTKYHLLSNFGVSNISQLPDVRNKISNTNLEKYGSLSYFGSETAKEKIKKTNLEKYGVDNYTKTDEYIDKVKKTNLEKYGYEWYLSSDDKKLKSDKTNLEKYGTTVPSKSEIVKLKIINTNIQRYGFKSPLLNNDIRVKSSQTLYKNWKVTNPLESPDIREKSIQTNLKKYGHPYPMQSDDVIKLRKDNNLSKYGHEYPNHSEEFRKNNFYISNYPNYIKYIGNSISLFYCNKCEIDFEIHTDNFYRRIEQNLNLCTLCNPIGNSVSIKEKELFDFIQSNYKGKIIQSYRDGLEIDIFLPELNLGFEFNGLYWHSSEYLDKNYHLNKLNHFKEKGIRIFNVWEDDWVINQNLIKSMILNILIQNTTKIYARNCDVRFVIDVKTIKEFLNKNHIQGWVNSKVKIGLYFKNELVSLMIFDQMEGRKKMGPSEWNISRFCNKMNHIVVGGASKILNYFTKNFSVKRIISFADKDWSDGDMYYKLGFDKIYETKPDYKYLKNGVRRHKSNFKLNESEVDLPKIWDCGKIKFEKII